MIKRLLAPMMILIFLLSALPAQAQVADIAFGINLGLGLLSRAAAARRKHQQQRQCGQSNADDCGGDIEYSDSHPSGYGSTFSGGVSIGRTHNQEDDNDCAMTRSSSHASTGSRHQYDENTEARAISSYNKGVKALNNQRYESAIKSFQEALQLNPDMSTAHGALGFAYDGIRDYEHALSELEIELKKGTRDKDIYFTAASVALKLQSYKRANELFTSFLKKQHAGNQADFAKTVTEILDKDYFHPAEGDYFADATKGQLRRWSTASKPLKVYIQENSSIKGYKAEFVGLLKDAFAEWSRGSAGKLRFEFTNNASEAQIKCAWTDDRSMLGSSNNELGVTETSVTENGSIFSASICLYTLVDDSNRSAEQVLRTAKNVDLHEIGHALGLDHSQHVYDIMYPVAFPEGLAFPLSARDTNTLVAVYSAADTSSLAGTVMTGREALNVADECEKCQPGSTNNE